MEASTSPPPSGAAASPPAKEPVAKKPMLQLSDSDSDLEDQTGALANLNVSDRLKQILGYRAKLPSKGTIDLDDDDDDDDDEDLFLERSTPSLTRRKPAIPGGASSSPSSPAANTTPPARQPTITATSATRLQPVDSQETRKQKFQEYLTKALYSDSSEDENEDTPAAAAKPKTKKKRAKATDAPKKTKKKPAAKKKDDDAAKKKKKAAKKKKSGDDDDPEARAAREEAHARFLMNTRMFKGDGSDDDDDDVEQFLRRGTMAILTDTSSSEEDDSMPSKPKPLSKRAQMDMHRETQRLRRSNQVMIKPRSTRKSLDALARTIGMHDDVEMPPASPLNDGYAEDMEDDQENDENDDNQPKRHVRFHLSDGMSSNDQSDDELEIVGKPRRRGDRLVRSWEAHKMQLASPDHPGGASPPSPWRAPFHAIQHGGSRRENRLRALNQRLLAKISQDQQQYRKNIEAKAKAMGIYMTPEERAKSHVEREQEAAVIDLEIQQLMNKRKQQQWAPKNTNDPDDDAATADGLVLSGEDEDYEDDDDDDDSMDQDNASVATSTITIVTNKSAPGNDNDDDDENDTNLFMSQRSKAARAKKARSRHKLLDDDYDASAAKKSIAQAAPEPVNSIARFFGGNKTNADADDEEEDVGGSVTLTRLMQRSSLTDDDNDNDKDVADDDKQVDNDAEDDDEAMSEQEAAAADAAAHAALDSPLTSRTINAFDLLQSSPAKPRAPMPRSKYLEHEAEESEDEFFGIAGADEVETEDFDRFEQDGMLVHENNENVDTQALMAQHNQKMLESDQHMVEKLIKDITSGGLRRKRGAQAAGLMLEDYDLYDDEGDDLVALRLAAATKRKKHLSSDDPLTQLASDPKTAAFAKAALDIPGALELSGDEMDDDDTNAAPATDTDTQPGTSTSNHAATQAEAELEDERLAHLQELAAFSRRHFFNKVKARKLGGVSS